MTNMRREDSHESKIISKTYVRKVQGNQEKGSRNGYLREPEAQTKTGLTLDVYSADHPFYPGG